MTPYLLTFGLAVVLALGVTPLARHHSGERRLRHGRTRAVAAEKPRVGGLIIFAAFCAAPFLAAQLSETAAAIVEPKWREIVGLCAVAFLVFLLGYLDDVRELAWPAKSFGLLAAALLLYTLGYRLGGGCPAG